MKKLIILSFLLLTFQSSDLYGQTGPWGPRVPPSSGFPRGRPMSPWGQAARIAREQAWRYVQEQKRQIEAGWEQHRVEGEHYGNALRREQEAHRQAEYAERYFPNTAVSRSYRQAANEASMNRARGNNLHESYSGNHATLGNLLNSSRLDESGSVDNGKTRQPAIEKR